MPRILIAVRPCNRRQADPAAEFETTTGVTACQPHRQPDTRTIDR